MTTENKHILLQLLAEYQQTGIAEQIDYEKFYLYSIITHSTAIEGSTVTEVEAQLLFDEGVTSGKRTLQEQMMNIDLKDAYEFGRQWIMRHEPITIDSLVLLSSKVMAHTGSEYHTPNGDFSAAKGELRKLNVTAGPGGDSYMSFQKVPQKLEVFCRELNERRSAIDSSDIMAVYDLSFWAHYELVTIHPWADGNGRTSRLLMNLLQMEFDLLPAKVLKEDKAEYIEALIEAREKENAEIFVDCMARLHALHLRHDIKQFVASMRGKVADKSSLMKEMVDKWSIKPSLAEKMADILVFVADKEKVTTTSIVQHFGFADTTAKRYLRQLTALGYLQARGGNKNRTYFIQQ